MRRLILVTLFVVAACGDNEGGGDPPTVQPATLSTDEDMSVTGEIEASDPEGGSLVLTAARPMHGTVTVDKLRVTYTPDANYNGPDGFQVTVSNGQQSAAAQVAVVVRAVNDAPEAVDDSFATTEDTPLVTPTAALLANDTDVDGDTLTVTSVGNATHGTVAKSGDNITFTPAPDYNGAASYEYTISDGTAVSTATVSIAVGGVNDPPVAVDDAVNGVEDTNAVIAVATLLANDTDADGQTLTVTGVGNATHGTVALAGGTVTFTPAANYNGIATFDYTVSDGAASDTGTVTVTIAPVNDAPVAVDDSATTPEDQALQLPASALLANDTDVDGPSLSVTAVGGAVNGTVALAGGIVTFTPALNFNGIASFTYTVSDGSLTDTGAVTITVTPVNDAPVATDDTGTTAEDTPFVVAASVLLANDTDVDGPSLSVTQVGGAIHGTVALAGGTITFTPTPNYNGPASFTYTVSDGTLIDTGLVQLTVTPVNDPPVAGDDTATVTANTPLVIPVATLLANDTDIDGPSLSITSVGGAVNGSVVLAAGAVTFTPTPNFVGAASFTYVVSDGSLTDTATVAVTVTPASACGNGTLDPGESCDDGNTAANDGCNAACAIEPGWTCSGAPSVCTTVCGDGIRAGAEACDDGDADDTDGCTSLCVVGALCNAGALPGADRFAVDPATGHCYASYDGEATTFGDAQTACAAAGGYLATITSAGEQALVLTVRNPAQNPWIGASEDSNDTDDVFVWVTEEPFTFRAFAPGQPDDDAAEGGNGDCLHLMPSGLWNDTNCNLDTFVIGRICETEVEPCGDGVRQTAIGEECDDGNTTGGDGCSATCQFETGCGDGVIEPGEECDDDNVLDGDGCSATCQLEDGCGDGNLDPGEQCDDDNTTSGDGCSATCQIEGGCGNGTVEPGEECDDGNTGAGDGCSATCQLEDGCGDGNLDPGEQCDDDNTTSGDGCSATCQRELLSVFSFNGSNGNEATFPADAPLPPGLASLPVMRRGSGLAATSAANAFSASGWTLATTLDANDYFSFTVTPAAGFSMSLGALELDEKRSGTGIRTWSVRSSLDGWTTDLQTFTIADTDTNTHVNQSIPLPAAFQNLTAPVEFRIYGYRATAAGGTWRIDNVEIYGATKLP